MSGRCINGERYFPLPGIVNQGDAQLECNTKGARLAIAKDQDQFLYISEHFDRVWIGLEGNQPSPDVENIDSFFHVDGFNTPLSEEFRQVSVFPWAISQPNNNNGDIDSTEPQNCVISEEQGLSDRRCSDLIGILCSAPCDVRELCVEGLEYFLFSEQFDQPTATQICVENNMTLATITSLAQFDAALATFPKVSNELDTSQTRRGGAWIGIVGDQPSNGDVRVDTFSDINDEDNSFFPTVNVFPWHSVEPNNSPNSPQNCVVLEQSSDFGYADKNCNDNREVLCSRVCGLSTPAPTFENTVSPTDAPVIGNIANTSAPTSEQFLAPESISQGVYLSLSVSLFVLMFPLTFYLLSINKEKRRLESQNKPFNNEIDMDEWKTGDPMENRL